MLPGRPDGRLCATVSLDYHKFMRKLAHVNFLCNKAERRNLLEKTHRALQEINAAATALPDSLRADGPILDSLPTWVPFQRHLATCTAHFLRLSLAQRAFSYWLKPHPQWLELRQTAIDAAYAIQQEVQKPLPAAYRRNWSDNPIDKTALTKSANLLRISVSATLSAGVFLVLLQICSPASPITRQHVTSASAICIDLLESVKDFSVVARQGARILRHLVQLETDLSHISKSLSPEEILALLSTKSTSPDTLTNSCDHFAILSDNILGSMDMNFWPFDLGPDGDHQSHWSTFDEFTMYEI